ncbi:MAG: GDSL-type esterase/lipase family protein [Ferruginibacter sp.]
MKQTLLLFLTVIFFSCSSTNQLAAQKIFTPADGNIMGRAIKNADSTVTLSASASSCTYTFSGENCVVYLKNNPPYPGDYNYINIELDGQYVGREKVDVRVAAPYIIKAVGNDMQHTLVISKATEAANGQVIITKIEAEKLSAPQQKFKTKVEFIGNSITCGFGNDMEIPCGNGSKWYDQHNAYWSYAPRTARALNAQFMISAISGAGIYRNWNSDGPTVPQQYENTYLNTDSSNKWNFSSFVPDMITIALGTNDLSNGDGKTPRKPFDKTVFISTYENFIKTIYSHYPQAQLVLMNSPMVNGERDVLLKDCLTTIQTDINNTLKPVKPVKTFWFKSMVPKGCSYHPSMEDDDVMAQQLVPFLKTLL